MANLAPETEALLKEFAVAARKHRVWTDLHRIFEQFTAQALAEFTSYRGEDRDVLMSLRDKWQARLDFQRGIEAYITDQQDRQDDIADQLGVDIEQLELRSDIEA